VHGTDKEICCLRVRSWFFQKDFGANHIV
jgi:hypothetical protein